MQITKKQYQQEVEALAEQISSESLKYDRDICEVLHETIDGHQWVIYYAYHDDVLKHSEQDAEEIMASNFGTEYMGEVVKEGGLGRLKTLLAFTALEGDVMDSLHDKGLY